LGRTAGTRKGAKIILMFPGQGSQHEKMGRQFLRFNSKYRKYLEIAGEITGADLFSIIDGEDPVNSLDDTRFSQISIYSLSCALSDYLLEDLSLDRGCIYSVIGHSLGEYSALYCCGAYDFRKGAELVAYRAKIMKRAAKGMMAAVMGVEKSVVEDVLKGYRGRVFIANYNDYTQLVISGYEKDVEDAAKSLKGKGAKKVIPLKVGIASHCPLMGSASEELGNFIEGNAAFKNLRFPFLSTTEAKYIRGAGIKNTLTGQLINPIRWVESIEFLLGREADTFIEIGPGRVLSGLMGRIARSSKKNPEILSTDSLEGIEVMIDKLRAGGLLK
jgi:malonyl CoA-acyl carrier protein transacylase